MVLKYDESNTDTHSFFSTPLPVPQEFCQALQQPDAKVFKNYLKVGIWKSSFS